MAVPPPLPIAIRPVPAQLAGITHRHLPVQRSKISDFIAAVSPGVKTSPDLKLKSQMVEANKSALEH